MTPTGFHEAVHERVAADARRFERIAAQLRLAFGGLGAVAMLANWESNTLATMVLASAVFAVELAWATLLYARIRKDSAPDWTKWVSAVMDVSCATALSASGLLNYSGAYETLLAPVFVALYPPFMLFTALNGNVRLSLFAGVLAAAERLGLFAYVVSRGLVRTTEQATYGTDAVSIPDQVTVAGFLFVIGGLFAALSGLLRREWQRSAEETLHKLEAERKQAHFRKYLSAAVADYVTQSPEAMTLGGARRTAAVVFVDIRDFTPFAERERPERVVEFLNLVFSELVTIVFAHGGTLDKFLGDGLMAVFGVPKEGPDSAEHAVRAAVDMQACARRLSAAGAAAGHEFRIGVGIAFGEVIAGNLGSPERMEFTVIGDTVNYASRLQGLCKDLAQDIVVSDAVHAAAPGFRYLRMPPVKVKGKSGEPTIWAVLDR